MYMYMRKGNDAHTHAHVGAMRGSIVDIPAKVGTGHEISKNTQRYTKLLS